MAIAPMVAPGKEVPVRIRHQLLAAPDMRDNPGAGRGRLPDAAQRRRMVKLIEEL